MTAAHDKYPNGKRLNEMLHTTNVGYHQKYVIWLLVMTFLNVQHANVGIQHKIGDESDTSFHCPFYNFMVIFHFLLLWRKYVRQANEQILGDEFKVQTISSKLMFNENMWEISDSIKIHFVSMFGNVAILIGPFWNLLHHKLMKQSQVIRTLTCTYV